MSDRPTPLCNRQQFHRDNGHAREHSIVVSVEFARDLERKLAEARVALERIAQMSAFSDNSIELRIAREALACIDAPGASSENSPPRDESAKQHG